jgi:hypothetical protein
MLESVSQCNNRFVRWLRAVFWNHRECRRRAKRSSCLMNQTTIWGSGVRISSGAPNQAAKSRACSERSARLPSVIFCARPMPGSPTSRPAINATASRQWRSPPAASIRVQRASSPTVRTALAVVPTPACDRRLDGGDQELARRPFLTWLHCHARSLRRRRRAVSRPRAVLRSAGSVRFPVAIACIVASGISGVELYNDHHPRGRWGPTRGGQLPVENRQILGRPFSESGHCQWKPNQSR